MCDLSYQTTVSSEDGQYGYYGNTVAGEAVALCREASVVIWLGPLVLVCQAGVGLLVVLQLVFQQESLVAHHANKWPQIQVSSLVVLQVMLVLESIAAHAANKRLGRGMRLGVIL